MELPELVCRYAGRFVALGGGTHHVGSPLGAWLVLALAAPAATGSLAEQLTDSLGTDPDSACRMATGVLNRRHPAVSAAAAAWALQGLTGLDGWRAGLPATVTTGPIPTPDEANTWARDNTLGLIERFPVDVTQVAIVLASALATRVTWLTPFETTDATELHGPWGRQLSRVLRTPRHGPHHTYITDTVRAGRVAVHSAIANGLDVISVLAEPEVAPAEVLAAAHDICLARARNNAVSLFDLPLGDHPLWTITEVQASHGGQHLEALLPAWHAVTEHKLLSVPSLGFQAAGQGLQRLADLGVGRIEAAQNAVARYSRRGFEAAAITAVAVTTSARRPPPPGPYRTATVRFAHPYAVVAMTDGQADDDPWHGLPVFAAWISDPDDTQD
jgi:hypothetical protein